MLYALEPPGKPIHIHIFMLINPFSCESAKVDSVVCNQNQLSPQINPSSCSWHRFFSKPFIQHLLHWQVDSLPPAPCGKLVFCCTFLFDMTIALWHNYSHFENKLKLREAKKQATQPDVDKNFNLPTMPWPKTCRVVLKDWWIGRETKACVSFREKRSSMPVWEHLRSPGCTTFRGQGS